MTAYMDIQREIRRYLLGGVAPDVQRRVEERLLTEEDFLEELTLAEEELIDDYVVGRLSTAERSEFEQHFLSTEERRRQLRFTRALNRYASAESADEFAGAREPTPPAVPTWGERLRAFWGGERRGLRAALALGAVAVVACALWLALPGAPRAPRTFATLKLNVGMGDRAAGEQAAKVKLPLAEDALRVTLTLPAGARPAAKYRVELLSDRGLTEPLEVDVQDAGSVSVVIPRARLARGEYALKLFGVESGGAQQQVGSYLFNVE